MGYGAVIPDGYGVSYNLQASTIIFCVASFFQCHQTDSRKEINYRSTIVE
jgi:choline O-acetyltransferase